MVIVGESCPNLGMEFLIDNSISKRPDVAPISSEIYKVPFLDETKQNIAVVVIGRFHYSGSKQKRNAFDLDRVLDLKVIKPAQ